MRFGLDWDGTGEEAQELFLNFCKNAIALGNEVHIVTMRYPSEGGNIPKEFLDAYQHLVTEFIQPKEDHTALIYRDFE